MRTGFLPRHRYSRRFMARNLLADDEHEKLLPLCPGVARRPARRFDVPPWENGGLFTATSPDGLRWTATGKTPVLTDIGDIIALSRDPIRGRYLLTCNRAVQGAADRAGPSAAGPVRLAGRRAGGRHAPHPAAATRRFKPAGQRRRGGRAPGAGVRRTGHADRGLRCFGLRTASRRFVEASGVVESAARGGRAQADPT